ncbi:MAG: class I SAM-dependent methyltransferase [Coriobacteriia bacterium]
MPKFDANGHAVIEIGDKPLMVDLGCGRKKPEGFIGIDVVDLPGVDIVADIGQTGIPLPNDSADVVRAYDFLEHVEDKMFLMNEIYRVLKPGGIADIFVPSTDGRGAFQDPTHVSFWNENSFYYYTVGGYRDEFEYYGIDCSFVAEELSTTPLDDRSICHVMAKLRAVK